MVDTVIDSTKIHRTGEVVSLLDGGHNPLSSPNILQTRVAVGNVDLKEGGVS